MKRLIILIFLIFGSRNLESNWEKIDSPIGGTLSQFSRLNDEIYSLVLNSGIYKYSLPSNKWTKFQSKNDLFRLTTAFDIDTNNSLFYIASYKNGLYKSSDNINWSQIHSGKNENGDDIRIIKIKSYDNYVIFISNKNIYFSSDFGNSWTNIKNNLPNVDLYDFVFFESKIYLATNIGLIISSDFGVNWDGIVFQDRFVYGVYNINNRILATVANMNSSPVDFLVYEKEIYTDNFNPYFENPFKGLQILNISSFKNDVIIHTLEAKSNKYNYVVFVSKDNANIWIRTKTIAGLDLEFLSNASIIYGDKILLGTINDGVYSFNLEGNNEEYVNKGIDGILLNSFFENDNIKVASSINSGLYYKLNSSNNWVRSATSPKYEGNYKIISNLINVNGKYIASTNQGIYQSNDGIVWSEFALLEYAIQDIIDYNDIMYALGNFNSGYLFSSTDMGNSWSSKKLPDEAIAISFYVDFNRILVGTSLGLFESTDDGNSWNLINGEFIDEKIIRNIIRQNNNSLLLSTTKNIYKSEDDGFSWLISNVGLDNFTINGLNSIDNVTIASTSLGTAFSYDYGVSWTLFNKGFESISNRKVSIKDSTLIAFQNGGGIYKNFLNKIAPIKIINSLDKIICKQYSFDIFYDVNPSIVFNSNNTFYVQISNENGIFDEQSRKVGEVNSTKTGVINVTIPEDLNSGNQYRFRVVSSSPALIGADNSEDITITDRPQPEISGELQVCLSKIYNYSIEKASGFDIKWTVTNGEIIGDDNKENVAVNWINVGVGTLKVTLEGITNCSGEGGLVVEIFSTPDKPTITFDGTRLISSSSIGNQWYFNGEQIPNANGVEFIPLNDGIYNVRVINEHSCYSEFSEPFYFSNFSDKLIFKIDTISSYTGDDVWINVRLLKNKKFYDLNIENISFDLVSNATLLYPKENNKGVVIEPNRFLRIETDTNFINDNIIAAIQMKVMLGNSDKSELSIQNLKINEQNFSDYLSINGILYLLDVCYEGGPRLITNEPYLKIDKITPNPIIGNFLLSIYSSESQYTSIFLTDIFGNRIEKLFDGLLSKGIHDLTLKTKNYSIGEYFIFAESGYNSSIYKIIIAR